MLLANIPEPNAKTVQAYANEHNYIVVEFTHKEEVTYPNILRIIQTLINKARAMGCLEIALSEIHNHYNIMQDTHLWKITIYGFQIK